jgi:hypothetical protein
MKKPEELNTLGGEAENRQLVAEFVAMIGEDDSLTDTLMDTVIIDREGWYVPLRTAPREWVLDELANIRPEVQL